jgi:hypothetical protein
VGRQAVTELITMALRLQRPLSLVLGSALYCVKKTRRRRN